MTSWYHVFKMHKGFNSSTVYMNMLYTVQYLRVCRASVYNQYCIGIPDVSFAPSHYV